MVHTFRRRLTRDPLNVVLVFIGFYFAVTLADLGCYFSFVARGGRAFEDFIEKRGGGN